MADDERKLVANGHAALHDGGLGEEAPRQGGRRPVRDVPERRARAALGEFIDGQLDADGLNAKRIVQRKKHRSTLAGVATMASPARAQAQAQGLIQPRGNRYHNKKQAASSKVPSGEAASKSPRGK
jgi:hypothetical protein